MLTPQINTLLKRWNLPDGQGNIFNMSGAGLARYRDNNSAVPLDGVFWPTTNRAVTSFRTSRDLSGTATSKNRFGSERGWGLRHTSPTTTI